MALAVPLAKRARTMLAQSFPDHPNDAERAPDVAVRATLEALARGETHYTDRPGILPLREGVTRGLKVRFGVTVDPQANTVITCGATEARFVAVQELLTPDADETLYAGTAPERLVGALIVRGARLAETPEAARVLYLSSRMSEDEQRELLGHISDAATVVFEIDETATTFHPAQLGAFRERTVTIGDLGTDDGLGGWRVGFLAAPPASAAGLRDFKQALTICTMTDCLITKEEIDANERQTSLREMVTVALEVAIES